MSALDDVAHQREAEHATWSNGERTRLTSGDLATLEQAIATDGIGDLKPEDRLRLIETYVERCRRERPPTAPAAGSVVPIEHHTRMPEPLKPAQEPFAPGRPLPILTLRRHAAWALGFWALAVGLGALILKILAGGN